MGVEELQVALHGLRHGGGIVLVRPLEGGNHHVEEAQVLHALVVPGRAVHESAAEHLVKDGRGDGVLAHLGVIGAHRSYTSSSSLEADSVWAATGAGVSEPKPLPIMTVR